MLKNLGFYNAKWFLLEWEKVKFDVKVGCIHSCSRDCTFLGKVLPVVNAVIFKYTVLC